jgi:hypothetical protein
MGRMILFGMTLSVLVTGPHAGRVERALEMLEAALGTKQAEACRSYFEGLDWPAAPTLVITTDAEFPRPVGAAAAIVPGEPWMAIQLNPRRLADEAWPRLGACELASVLLHEMGHLARRDTHDREPKAFFRACRLRCLNPGRWR